MTLPVDIDSLWDSPRLGVSLRLPGCERGQLSYLGVLLEAVRRHKMMPQSGWVATQHENPEMPYVSMIWGHSTRHESSTTQDQRRIGRW